MVTGFYISHAQEILKLRIDPNYASSGSVSQLFDSVNYIPLETTKESLFGTIAKMVVTDEYFIIQDESTSAILLFEKNGKFHAKIPVKPMQILDFRYEKEARRILIQKTNTKAITPEMQMGMRSNSAAFLRVLKKLMTSDYYDLNGKKLKVKTGENSISPSYLFSIVFPGEIIASNLAMANEKMPDSTAFELNLYKNDKLYQSYFPYNTKRDVAQYGNISGGGFSKTMNDTAAYFTRPMDYSIYELTPHTLSKKIEMVFPLKNTLPKSFFTDTLSEEDRRKYLQDNSTFIVGLSNILFKDSSWYFHIKDNQRRRRPDYNFKYELKTGKLISFDKCSPDSVSYFLPIFDYPFSGQGFIAADNEFLYNHISSLRMFGEMERSKNKNPKYNSVLQNYFTKGDKKDNPVIVQLKPKA